MAFPFVRCTGIQGHQGRIGILMIDKVERVLVLAPHPDDGEFGAGGTLHQMASNGARIHYVAFSPCIKSLPEGSADDRLNHELNAAAKHLGISAEDVHMLDYPVREFFDSRQAILDRMIMLRKEFSPQLVFLPNSTDIHQDHQVIHQEGLRAFKHCSMLGYELPWNNLDCKTNFHVKLKKADMEAKFNALSCYESQKRRNYLSKGFIEGLALVRGTQVNTEYAEAFECVRWVS